VKTEISTDRNAAVELLRNGEIVALPTETVYGLAAHALDPIAVAKIFEAKGRPRFDPLIVHLPDNAWLEKIVDLPTEDRQLVSVLAKKFWPGPFTIVLPRKTILPEITTAGLETVAVRVSAHPVFAEIIRAFGAPLAAPSANRFGRISPTTARHVYDELSGRVPLIIDAGPTAHGIESTIVAVRDRKIEILRRGPITSDDLGAYGKVEIAKPSDKVSAPGQLPSHYAPKTPLRLVDDLKSFQSDKRCALLVWNPINQDDRFVAIRNLSEKQDLREAAANLFRYLRELDELDVDLIVAERVPDQGLGAAILDRLTRASHV
jgi:L-threonylcarbamoyladenylate synthase